MRTSICCGNASCCQQHEDGGGSHDGASLGLVARVPVNKHSRRFALVGGGCVRSEKSLRRRAITHETSSPA